MAESTGAQIIPFHREQGTFAPLMEDRKIIQPEVTRTVEGRTQTSPQKMTTIEDLYGSGSDPLSTNVLVARRTLQECSQRLASAMTAFNANDRIGADLETTRAFALLPELFCCRDISEGFGSLVLGLYYAFLNVKGEALTFEQLVGVQRCTEFLTENPFITFDSALDLLDELEDAGLSVDPSEATILGEVLASE